MTVDPTYVTHDIYGNEIPEQQRQKYIDKKPEIEGFKRHNWKDARSRDKWRDILDRAGEGRRMAEWMSVLDDRTEREAAIVHIKHSNRDEWLERVSEYDLVYKHIRDTQPYNGFTHELRPTDKSNPERLSYSVIAANEDVAEKMVEAETEFDNYERHRTVGELLGFPKCCRTFFEEEWIKNEHIDPIYETACYTDSATAIDDNPHEIHLEDPNPFTNTMWRYFGWAFVTHMPCSFECEETAEIGRIRGEIMAENGYRDAANALYEWLSLPQEWHGHKGMMRIENPHFIGSAETSTYWNKKRVVWNQEVPTGSVSLPGPQETQESEHPEESIISSIPDLDL